MNYKHVYHLTTYGIVLKYLAFAYLVGVIHTGIASRWRLHRRENEVSGTHCLAKMTCLFHHILQSRRNFRVINYLLMMCVGLSSESHRSQNLRLNSNSFRGTIPTTIGSLCDSAELWLQQN